jgi:hypothetical protein
LLFHGEAEDNALKAWSNQEAAGKWPGKQEGAFNMLDLHVSLHDAISRV